MDKNGHKWTLMDINGQKWTYLIFSFRLPSKFCTWYWLLYVFQLLCCLSKTPVLCMVTIWLETFVNLLVNSDNKFFSMLCVTFNRYMKGSRIASWLKALCRKLRPKHLSTEKSNLKACRLGTKKDGDGWKKLHWVTRVSWGVFWRKWRILRNVEAYCSSNRRTKNWQRR